ncbi:MAG TPA: tRNA lysidine(34) synthetase TilS [Desulfuromonadales bacterium]|nr:tRNA lysidine(34) synthetase TilS [Desulfuromonadales bacterium]
MTFESALLARVSRTIRQRQLFRTDDTLIVAISGGADSTALLDLLTRLPGYNLRLVAAHLNHCLRDADSDGDQEFCHTLAERCAIPFESQRIAVKQLAEQQHLNLEDAGRQARIRFLDQLRSINGAAAVVLAHHADDQAETVLMRLLRGSGITGLSGMAHRNQRGYVRPLLDIPRSEIERYLRERGLSWREDASNRDTDFLRNRIRHQLLPVLEQYNPAIRSTLSSTAAIIGDDESLLADLAEQTCDTSFRRENDAIVGTISQLTSLHPALLRRVLRHALKTVTGTLEAISQRHIAAICAMVAAERPNARLALPHGVSAIREYDLLRLRSATVLQLPSTHFDFAQRKPFRTGRSTTVSDAGFELTITAPGRYPLPEGGSLCITATSAAPIPTDATSICIDLNKLPFPWQIRTFRSGDRMIPFGMHGRKKVKDVFIDRKIPVSVRRRIPLLFCGDQLVWIAGVCVSEIARVDSVSDRMVRVSLD